ncbi:ankyrin repeat-containing domain protein [Hypoxylon fuscum]|nr:ankyrin repeat-containing domain protein [Hypoxylon fuscum]
MEIASSSTSKLVQSVVGQQALGHAIYEFQSFLTDQQRYELGRINAVPDADTILVFTAELDAANRERKGRSVATRLHLLLLSVRDFCSVIDTVVSSHPEIAALIWGSVKLTMQVIVNYTSYYEAVSDLFMRLGKLCPVFAEYQTLFRNSRLLRQSLSDFHASIIRCCKHVIEAIQRPWHNQVLRAFWTSFEQEFKPDLDDIQRCSNYVKSQINLAKAQADNRDQQLQAQERAEASVNRTSMRSFFSRQDKTFDNITEWRLQREKQRALTRKQQLLDALSTYDHLRVFKQSQRKRFGTTASWICSVPEFRRWLDKGGSPLLWCSGKIGSGKTIATASVIDYLLLEKGRSDCFVSFFFVQSDDQESLKALSIMRSLVRQRLPEPTQLPDNIEESLRKLNSYSELDDIAQLLSVVTIASKRSYIIIDGLDECDKQNRVQLLGALSSLVDKAQNTKVFVASRESLAGDVRSRFGTHEHILMDNSAAQKDIPEYVNGMIQKCMENGDLEVGDPSLITEIKQALIQGADGMFLWIALQIPDICSKLCDDDIRNTINTLPRDLTETFCRALRRISLKDHEKAAQQVFLWITASKRPLYLDELREAIAIEIGQHATIPGRLHNSMQSITSWCENLVQVEEEHEIVQFAHHTVRTFLLDKPCNPGLSSFHLNVEDADHHIGEICVTYLHFNDFKTTISPRRKPVLLPDPKNIAEAVIGRGSGKISAILSRSSLKTSKPIDLVPIVNSNTNGSTKAYNELCIGHPFLKFASTNWIFHTSNFQDGKSKTWVLWESLVIHDHDLATKPWEQKNFDVNNPIVLEWAQHALHYALLRLISSHILSSVTRRQFLNVLDLKNDVRLLNIIVESQNFNREADQILMIAVEGGHLEIVERLLAAKADVNAAGNGRTALQAAVKGGHLEIVERLLAAKTDVNAAGYRDPTALQAAIEGSHLKIAERLLAAKADVNATGNYRGRTALQIAAKGGYLEIVEKFLAAKADVNAVGGYTGRTALQAAVKGGHLEIVERLLAAKADVNATGGYRGRTALQIAAGGGYLEIVEKLLAAKADVNATGGYTGRTALQAAIKGGHLEIVERLLAAKADVNAADDKGYTALQAAVEGRHLKIVERLLAAKADVNVADDSYVGRTALQIAAGDGYLEIVEKLLAAKADVNATDRYLRCTALQLAVRAGHLDIVEKLRQAGAREQTFIQD